MPASKVARKITTLATPPTASHTMTPQEEALYHKWSVLNDAVCTLGTTFYNAYTAASSLPPATDHLMEAAYTGISNVNQQIVQILTGIQAGTAPNIPVPPAKLPPLHPSDVKLVSVLSTINIVMRDLLDVLPKGDDTGTIATLRDTVALVITAVNAMLAPAQG